jgi:hypothetical protein
MNIGIDCMAICKAGKQRETDEFTITRFLEESTAMLEKIKRTAANVTTCQVCLLTHASLTDSRIDQMVAAMYIVPDRPGLRPCRVTIGVTVSRQ